MCILSFYNYSIKLDYPINPTPRFGWEKPAHKKIYDIINNNRSTYHKNMELCLKSMFYLKQISSLPDPQDPTQPCWHNSYMTGLDAISLYVFTREMNPTNYYEIGSGYSTTFVKRAITDHKLKTKITAIDPSPRTKIDTICDKLIVDHLENIDLSMFEQLQKGDILFFDGSHRSFTNSDVTIFFLEIMPLLRPGVLVGIHDIFLPYDYPAEWNFRFYNEQYLLATALLANGNQFEIIFPAMFIRLDTELSQAFDLVWNYTPEACGCFWLRMN